MTTTLLRSLLLASTCCTPLLAQKPPTDAQRLATACNQFAADLHGKLAASGQPTCSPGSISITLLMLLPGASGNTAAELATVLHLPEDLRGDRLRTAGKELLRLAGSQSSANPGGGGAAANLRLTNDLWVQSGYAIAPSYVDTLRTSFGAGVHDADFMKDQEGPRKTINAHVAAATNGRIAELLPAGILLPTTRVVLTNALWFKAAWDEPFHEDGTAEEPFTLANGEKVRVPTMHQTEHFAYAETDAWQALSMPFAKSDVVGEILLPKAGASLAAAEAALLAGAHLKAAKIENVQVALPRFQVAGAHRLKEPLIALGMRDAFAADRADFSGMDPKRELFVTDVVHQTWIAVDEEGAEAAAATAAIAGVKSAPEGGPPRIFTADHHFAFALRQRGTGLLLFVGQVVDPRRRQG